MLKYEDECIGCPHEIGCLGDSCSYKNVPRHYCDTCGTNAYADFKIDGEELCRDCAEGTLEKIFADMSIEERAQALRVECEVLT